MKTYFLMAIFIFILHIENSKAQSAASFNNNIVPPSPTVAALQKYINYPVNLSTGVPDNSIPIYSIPVKGLNYPITLSYHASGIKVGEFSSNVGLGWSLSAMGMINIEANGMMDELSGFDNTNSSYSKISGHTLQGGYLGNDVSCESLSITQDPSLPFGNLLQLYNNSADINYLTQIMYNAQDSEPDLYTFSTSTIGGKFFQDESNVFRTIPASDNKIERTYNTNSTIKGYKITDGKGIVYYFELYNGTTGSSTVSSGSTDLDMHNGREYYLTKVVTPQGGELDFFYSSADGFTYQLVNQYSRSLYQPGPCTIFNTGAYGYASNGYSTTTVTQGGVRLDSIVTNNGNKVAFSYAATYRKDLPSNSGKAMTGIAVYAKGTQIKNTTFTYDYFNSSSPSSSDYNDFRLKLTSVQNSGEQPYLFTYNSTGLPNRLSLGLDHYGYSNGQSNSTLLPKDEAYGFDNGGIRDIDSVALKGDILTKIAYPTGGYVNYSYEPNDYWVASENHVYEAKYGGDLSSVPNSSNSTSVDVPTGSRRLLVHYENGWDGVNLYNDYCYLHINGPNGLSRDYFNSNMAGEPIYVTGGIELGAGHYTISTNTFGTTYSGHIYLSWYQDSTVAPHNELAGGLRVKQITAYTADGQVAYKKRFDYLKPGTTHSSGVNVQEPTYIDFKDDTKRPYDSESMGCPVYNCQAVVQSSSSVYPIVNGDGYSVVYSDVDEYDIDKNQNGYTHHLLNNYGGIPYANLPVVSYDWVNGKPLEEDTYSYVAGNYVLVHKQVNHYNYDGFDGTNFLYKANAAKITMGIPPSYCDVCGRNAFNVHMEDIQFGIQYYNFYSSWQFLTRQETTTYDKAGLNPVTDTTRYYYDNSAHLQLTRTSTTRSDGKVVTNVTTYPDDYASGTTFIDDMKSAHLTAMPIEQVSYQNDASGMHILKGQLTSYKTGGKGLADKVYSTENVTPVTASSFKFSSRATGQLPYGTSPASYSPDALYKEKLSYDQYDSQGNPLMLTPKDGIPASYIWGYNQQYPIAEIRKTKASNVFHQNFEESEGNSSAGDAHTGHKSKTGGYSHTVTGLDNGNYILSYWQKSGSSWIYQSSVVTAASNSYAISISSSLQVDDVCLYPVYAEITTYTYDPLVGMTSSIDTKAETTYYEYDSFQRLVNIRDKDRKILKHTDYHYQNQ